MQWTKYVLLGYNGRIYIHNNPWTEQQTGDWDNNGITSITFRALGKGQICE